MAADTLAIVRLLEAAGVDRGVAEAHATAIQHAVDDRQEHLATKADLEVRLAAMEARLTWRMVGLQFGVGGLIVAVLKFIP